MGDNGRQSSDDGRSDESNAISKSRLLDDWRGRNRTSRGGIGDEVPAKATDWGFPTGGLRQEELRTGELPKHGTTTERSRGAKKRVPEVLDNEDEPHVWVKVKEKGREAGYPREEVKRKRGRKLRERERRVLVVYWPCIVYPWATGGGAGTGGHSEYRSVPG